MRLIPESLHEEDAVAPAERSQAASRSTWVSVLVNVALSAAQILIGYFARSQALIADGMRRANPP